MSNQLVFVHEQAICDSALVGNGTRIWEFSHVLPGATIGTDCTLSAGVFVENDVRVGNRVTIKSGVQLWDGVCLEDDVFIGPNVSFANDPFPRSNVRPSVFLSTTVRRGASIGANATILPGLNIGRGAMVGAGSVVTRDVPDFAKVYGNPARIKGYVHPFNNSTLGSPPAEPGRLDPLLGKVEGVKMVELDHAVDLRGTLVAGEVLRDLPFGVDRFFLVFDVPSVEARGAHAHKQCHQFLVALGGTINVVVHDGMNSEEIILDKPNRGLYMPPLTWGTQYNYSPQSILLVLASHPYDPDDYIRDFDQFIQLRSAERD